MELQGIVFIQIQGIDTVVDFQGNSFKQHIFIHKKIIQGNYICSRNYIHLKEIIFIQGNYIHSSKQEAIL